MMSANMGELYMLGHVLAIPKTTDGEQLLMGSKL